MGGIASLTSRDTGHTRSRITKTPIPEHPAAGCDACHHRLAVKELAERGGKKKRKPLPSAPPLAP